MTATTVTSLPRPRNPLVDEMHEAFVQALAETDPQRNRFYAGLGIGYAVAFGLVTREALTRARLNRHAVNMHIDFRRPRFDDDEDTLWACGVRHGYALGTSERSDADECAMCGERLTDDDDTQRCADGQFCDNGECFTDWHANGPTTCGDESDL